MSCLLKRNAISISRNPLAFKAQITQTIVFGFSYNPNHKIKINTFTRTLKLIGLMFGAIFFQVELNQTGVQNINGLLFLFVTNISFSNMFPVINVNIHLIAYVSIQLDHILFRLSFLHQNFQYFYVSTTVACTECLHTIFRKLSSM